MERVDRKTGAKMRLGSKALPVTKDCRGLKASLFLREQTNEVENSLSNGRREITLGIIAAGRFQRLHYESESSYHWA